MKKLSAILLSSSLLVSGLSSTLPVMAEQPAETAQQSDEQINLALNRPASASSSEGTAGREPSAAVDGDPASRWASAVGTDGSGIDETWFQVDLGVVQEVSRVVISWESRPNRFRIQVSEDGSQWSDAGDPVDNGYLGAEGNKKVNTIEFGTVNARYVRMQGIQRRKQEGGNNRTGYSIYEMEVYGPAWDDAKYLEAAASQLRVPAKATRSFSLPVSFGEYGVSAAWTSDSSALQIHPDGKVTVIRTDEDQQAVLKAVLTRGGSILEKEYVLTVPAAAESFYEFSPVVQSVAYGDTFLDLAEGISVTWPADTASDARSRLNAILAESGIAAGAENSQVQLLAGVAGEDSEASAWLNSHGGISEDILSREEAYILKADAEENTIVLLGTDAAGLMYACYTLQDLLEQGGTLIRSLEVEDYPDIEFRGFIEGFYGSWSHSNRLSLLEYCGRYKMNTYIYGPKNDPYHYGQWKDPYPEDKLAELAELVETGREAGVNVVWAAHVGGRTDLSDADIEALEAKFDQLYDAGFRQFALFFDDSSTNNTRLVEYVNNIQHEYVDAKGDVEPLIFCPQYYRKNGASISYLKNLALFDERVQIMWTGDNVVSPIEQQAVDWITNLINRDVFIWWNWPVNDLGRANLMHLGPTIAVENGITGISGLTSNPMNQAQASKVALYSIADYIWNTEDYDAEASWKRAIGSVITDDEEASHAFEIFAQNCSAAPMSFSASDESVYMKPAMEALKNALLAETPYADSAAELRADLEELQTSVRILRAYPGTNGLSSEIGPWLNTAENTAKAGLYVLDHLSDFDDLSEDAAIQNALDTVKEARNQLAAAGGAKQAARKNLYPFIGEVIDILESRIYAAIDLEHPARAYGSFAGDYSLAYDGSLKTFASLGASVPGSFVGLNLGTVQPVHAVDIVMLETNNNKKGTFKSGVLEYSIDNVNWTEAGTFSGTEIHADLGGVPARFVRYRAVEVWEDEVTGENQSNIALSEIQVNQDQDWHVQTDLDLDCRKEESRLTLKSAQAQTLQPGEAVTVQFDVLKTVQMLRTEETGLQAETTLDGKTWSQVPWNTLKSFTSKAVRFVNAGDEAVSWSDVEVQFAGKVDLTASLSDTIVNDSGNGIYSGNAGNLVDGNENTTLWLKRGVTGSPRYIELNMPDVVPVEELEVIYKGDNNNGGHIDITTDGETWTTVLEFGKPPLIQVLDLGGVNASGIRYYINTGEWCQISEMSVNKNVKENAPVISGDLSALHSLEDRNLFTASASTTAGELIIDCINHPAPAALHILQDAGHTLHVQIWQNGEWKEAGDITAVSGVMDFASAGQAEKIRLSWDEAASIRELWLTGTLEAESAVNKTLLGMAIAYAEGVTEEDLTNVNTLVVQEFRNALQNARDVYANASASQEEVSAAWSRLVRAVQMLSFTSDKSALNALIVQAEEIEQNLNLYEAEGQEEFLAALEAARAVAVSDTALDESIQAAADRLQNAMEGLVRRELNLDLLNWLIAETEQAAEEDYTLASWTAFADVLAQAKAVQAAPESQAQVDDAVTSLHSAWLQLRLRPSEDMLAQMNGFLKTASLLNFQVLPASLQNELSALETETRNALDNPEYSMEEAADLIARQNSLLKQAAEQPGQSDLLTPDSTPDSLQPETPAQEESQVPAAEKSQTASQTSQSVKTAASAQAGLWSALGMLSLLGLAARRRNRK